MRRNRMSVLSADLFGLSTKEWSYDFMEWRLYRVHEKYF